MTQIPPNKPQLHETNVWQFRSLVVTDPLQLRPYFCVETAGPEFPHRETRTRAPSLLLLLRRKRVACLLVLSVKKRNVRELPTMAP